MLQNSQSLEQLIQLLSKFPGIGRKTAQRMAFYIFRMSTGDVDGLLQAISDVREKVDQCSICCNITETDPCQICQDENRKTSPIIIVEDAVDAIALEKIRGTKYRFHILHGRLSPLDGIGPDEIRIKELLARLVTEEIPEIIIATNPNVEGEATAMYLLKTLKPFNISISRIARGLPVGSDLEFSDEITLTEAIEGRRTMG